MVLTTFPPTTKNGYASGGVTDHRTPLSQRWASWYVTGRPGANRHMGNKPVPTQADTSAPSCSTRSQGRIDLKGYPTPYSDIAALMVFEHQTHMTNLLTYIGWEARVAEFERRGKAAPANRAAAPGTLDEIARDLVDYMLFVDETPLAGKIEGTSGFTQMFSAEGPRDSRGRSLRQLDLERRLMRYPCSYMIYSPLFDALPAIARDAIYRRMWEVLSGQDKQPSYSRLSLADRRAIVEILRDTKKDLPELLSSRPVRPARAGACDLNHVNFVADGAILLLCLRPGIIAAKNQDVTGARQPGGTLPCGAFLRGCGSRSPAWWPRLSPRASSSGHPGHRHRHARASRCHHRQADRDVVRSRSVEDGSTI